MIYPNAMFNGPVFGTEILRERRYTVLQRKYHIRANYGKQHSNRINLPDALMFVIQPSEIWDNKDISLYLLKKKHLLIFMGFES